jgi:hypothetical protein
MFSHDLAGTNMLVCSHMRICYWRKAPWYFSNMFYQRQRGLFRSFVLNSLSIMLMTLLYASVPSKVQRSSSLSIEAKSWSAHESKSEPLCYKQNYYAKPWCCFMPRILSFDFSLALRSCLPGPPVSPIPLPLPLPVLRFITLSLYPASSAWPCAC